MRDALEVRGAVSRGAFAVAALVSFAVLFAPPSDVPSAPHGVDKLVHASLFALLALTGRWAGGTRAVLTSGLVLYGAGSESVQGLIGRDAAVGDLLADVVGLFLVLAAWDWAARRSVH